MYTVCTASGRPLAETEQLELADLAVIRLNSHYGPAACHIVLGHVAGAPEHPTPQLEAAEDCELILGVLAQWQPELGGLITEVVYLLRGMLWTEARRVGGVLITYAADTQDAEQQLAHCSGGRQP
ncbi:hypothetical protein Dxin01_00819 [Deinococcus xinjiangensis]|uniref:Uncharacterized protein n=1 Tax=Deinococcus xinjiangensis TaxID=457454 RepID=A0ABP9V729_9DEIO